MMTLLKFGLVIAGLWLVISASISNHKMRGVLRQIYQTKDVSEATRRLHKFMAGSNMREPYQDASPEYVSWVHQQVKTMNTGKKIAGVVLWGVAWYLTMR